MLFSKFANMLQDFVWSGQDHLAGCSSQSAEFCTQNLVQCCAVALAAISEPMTQDFGVDVHEDADFCCKVLS